MIPDNIGPDHILRALRLIASENVPPNREGKLYVLIHEGRRYPPKYVISIANKFANGEVLAWTEFRGGPRTNKFLSERGFAVRRR